MLMPPLALCPSQLWEFKARFLVVLNPFSASGLHVAPLPAAAPSLSCPGAFLPTAIPPVALSVPHIASHS
jgi:hypothetical protein